jgi:hypothetical protein
MAGRSVDSAFGAVEMASAVVAAMKEFWSADYVEGKMDEMEFMMFRASEIIEDRGVAEVAGIMADAIEIARKEEN